MHQLVVVLAWGILFPLVSYWALGMYVPAIWLRYALCAQ